MIKHNLEGAKRPGDWITTYTGKQFWVLDPREDEIELEDICHALSRVNRFGGHLNAPFYSVAQHSVYVSDCVDDPRFKLQAILHDAAEAYIGDMVRPLKRLIPQFGEIEDAIIAKIFSKFGVESNVFSNAVIKTADDTMCKREVKTMHLKPYLLDWAQLPPGDLKMQAVDGGFYAWPPDTAKARFRDRLLYLLANTTSITEPAGHGV